MSFASAERKMQTYHALIDNKKNRVQALDSTMTFPKTDLFLLSTRSINDPFDQRTN